MKRSNVSFAFALITVLSLTFGLYQKFRADRLEKLNYECGELANRLKAEVALITAIAVMEKEKSICKQVNGDILSSNFENPIQLKEK